MYAHVHTCVCTCLCVYVCVCRAQMLKVRGWLVGVDFLHLSRGSQVWQQSPLFAEPSCQLPEDIWIHNFHFMDLLLHTRSSVELTGHGAYMYTLLVKFTYKSDPLPYIIVETFRIKSQVRTLFLLFAFFHWESKDMSLCCCQFFRYRQFLKSSYHKPRNPQIFMSGSPLLL